MLSNDNEMSFTNSVSVSFWRIPSTDFLKSFQKHWFYKVSDRFNRKKQTSKGIPFKVCFSYFFCILLSILILLWGQRILWKIRYRHLWNDREIIPTRSLQINLKRICLWDLTKNIYIICIIGKAYAIRFFVAILLP